jgi:phosphohistidine phosphatase
MIWLLRHGDAEDGTPDAERRLTPKGEKQARAAGAALGAMGVRLDACLTSPRVRAADTARLACADQKVEPSMDERLSGGPFDVLELALGLGTPSGGTGTPSGGTGTPSGGTGTPSGGTGDVLLVGHEPDLSEAIARATGARLKLKKGGLAAIDDRELHLLVRPRELRAMADRP